MEANQTRPKKMADFFEFQESDIIFSDDFSNSNQTSTNSNSNDFPSISRSILRRSNLMKEKNCSVPVNIPDISHSKSNSNSSSFGCDEVEFGGYFADDDDDDDQMIVPPHVIVDRRRSSDYDSYEKNGRGKNLIHVRNSILKLTGFLES